MRHARFVSVETLPPASAARLDWVDIAKGICIVLVVMMHSTLGVEKAVGAESGLHAFIDWAKPFRMPDFFFISGLFLAARIGRPWRSYLDTKVVHFAYFYALWVTIHIGLRAGGLIDEMGFAGALGFYLVSFVEPYGTLWFIYMLAIFFVAAKLAHGLPRAAVCAAAVVLYLVMPHTGVLVVDEFADRFVFFYAGYWLAPAVFAYAEKIDQGRTMMFAGALALWALANALAVADGLTAVPGLDLLFSAAGVAAVITTSVLLRPTLAGDVLRYCGSHSIAIYLAFTIFMAVTRSVLLKAPVALPPELVALACTFAGVVGALLMERAVRGTRAAFLFTRPAMFRLQPGSKAGASVASVAAT
jgi:uncharacterized membrane protein YcfT